LRDMLQPSRRLLHHIVLLEQLLALDLCAVLGTALSWMTGTNCMVPVGVLWQGQQCWREGMKDIVKQVLERDLSNDEPCMLLLTGLLCPSRIRRSSQLLVRRSPLRSAASGKRPKSCAASWRLPRRRYRARRTDISDSTRISTTTANARCANGRYRYADPLNHLNTV
jgi:hypothetical protein